MPPVGDARPSNRFGDDTWERAHAATVDVLRQLIRIPSINPPDPAGPELAAARVVASVLEDSGLEAEILEPVPGRGSVSARLRGDGTGGGPLLLLSHLDVVPATGDGWTHDPFAADVADGYVWGRGSVDMKQMLALELGVVRLLCEQARAAGRNPASDPVPGLTRDIILTSTADEEAGGWNGAGWIADNRPELLRADAALNECGGVSVEFAGRRFYPIGVAEKGYANFRIAVTGTWGHGSMPRDDNAAVRAARIVERLATNGPARPTAVMTRFLDEVARALPTETATTVRAITDGDEEAADRALGRICAPAEARALRALLHDTSSPNVIHAGIKYNVIPGAAEIIVDCRTLPGTDPAAMEAELRRRIGDELLEHATLECMLSGPAVEASLDGPLYPLLADAIRAHDRDGIPVPVMMPFATDAKHTARLGVPTFGFSPLRLDPAERFLERFHGVDERVSLEALRFGLPVLYDAVRSFCG